MIGRRSYAAFGNSTGDRQMLGVHWRRRWRATIDDRAAQRKHAYGPADGLPDTKVGAFTQALYDEAKHKSWTVIGMKNDWKRIFASES